MKFLISILISANRVPARGATGRGSSHNHRPRAGKAPGQDEAGNDDGTKPPEIPVPTAAARAVEANSGAEAHMVKPLSQHPNPRCLAPDHTRTGICDLGDPTRMKLDAQPCTAGESMHMRRD